MPFHNKGRHVGIIRQSLSSLDYSGVQGPNHEPLSEASSTNCLLFFLPLSALNELDWEELENRDGKTSQRITPELGGDGAIFYSFH